MLEQFEPAMEFPDRFIMGMRLINGMSYDILKKIHIDLPKAVDLIYNDYRTFFIKENDIIRFSGKGFLFSNTMLSMIIDKVREMG